MVAVDGGLLVGHAGRGVVHVHEDGARAVARQVEQLAQVRGVVGRLHHGIVDHRAGDVDPAHDIGVDGRERVKVHGGHVVAVGALDGVLLQVAVGRLRLLVAELRLDEQAARHEQERHAHRDERGGDNLAALAARLVVDGLLCLGGAVGTGGLGGTATGLLVLGTLLAGGASGGGAHRGHRLHARGSAGSGATVGSGGEAAAGRGLGRGISGRGRMLGGKTRARGLANRGLNIPQVRGALPFGARRGLSPAGTEVRAGRARLGAALRRVRKMRGRTAGVVLVVGLSH